MIKSLQDAGRVVWLEKKFVFHVEAMEKAEKLLREYLGKNGKITVSDFRQLIGTSRKYALPILAYFDRKQVTRREGEYRYLF